METIKRIYNSTYEVKLRVLLLLYALDERYLSSDKIVAYDFISVYGKEFDIASNNLHGDNYFKFSELPSRREIVSKSIKILVLEGMLDINLLNGFEYKLSDRGFNFASSLESEYATEYIENVNSCFKKFNDYSEADLLKYIQSKATVSMKECDFNAIH